MNWLHRPKAEKAEAPHRVTDDPPPAPPATPPTAWAQAEAARDAAQREVETTAERLRQLDTTEGVAVSRLGDAVQWASDPLARVRVQQEYEERRAAYVAQRTALTRELAAAQELLREAEERRTALRRRAQAHVAGLRALAEQREQFARHRAMLMDQVAAVDYALADCSRREREEQLALAALGVPAGEVPGLEPELARALGVGREPEAEAGR